MKKFSAQYIAGFFDGEGCVTIAKPTKTSKIHRVRITVGQKYSNVLKKIKLSLGYGLIYHYKNGGRFDLRINRVEEAKHFIKLILPYVFCKKPELELTLKFLTTKLNLTVKEREQYYRKLQQLKRIPH